MFATHTVLVCCRLSSAHHKHSTFSILQLSKPSRYLHSACINRLQISKAAFMEDFDENIDAGRRHIQCGIRRLVHAQPTTAQGWTSFLQPMADLQPRAPQLWTSLQALAPQLQISLQLLISHLSMSPQLLFPQLWAGLLLAALQQDPARPQILMQQMVRALQPAMQL